MSLPSSNLALDNNGFPRVSGDEPAKARPTHAWYVFSPRERG